MDRVKQSSSAPVILEHDYKKLILFRFLMKGMADFPIPGHLAKFDKRLLLNVLVQRNFLSRA